MRITYRVLPAVVLCCSWLSQAFAVDKDFQQKVWQVIDSMKSESRPSKEEFVDINPKQVIFPHKKHQALVKELNTNCTVCHHKWREIGEPRACKKCHTKVRIAQGKFAPKGKKVNPRDIFHLLCWDCHDKMLKQGYSRADGSVASIPTKCHHCHVVKDK